MKKNKNITVIGLTDNMKEGAVLYSEKEGVYRIEGLRNWEDLTNKTVKVTGVLDIVKIKAVDTTDGKIEQGFNRDFDMKVIRNAKWELVE